MHIKRLLLVFALIVTIIFTGCGDSKKTKAEKESVQGMMLEYLEEKYSKEFEVKFPQKTGNSGFGTSFVAEVVSKDEAAIVFSIAWYPREPENFAENYLSSLWSSQGKEKLEATMEAMYEEDFYVEYHINMADKEGLESKNHDDLEEMLKIKNHISISFDCYIFMDDNDFDKNKEAENAYEIMNKYTFEDGTDNYSIWIIYFSTKYKKEFYKSLGIAYLMEDLDELHKNGYVLNVFWMFRTDERFPPKDGNEAIEFFLYE